MSPVTTIRSAARTSGSASTASNAGGRRGCRRAQRRSRTPWPQRAGASRRLITGFTYGVPPRQAGHRGHRRPLTSRSGRPSAHHALMSPRPALPAGPGIRNRWSRCRPVTPRRADRRIMRRPYAVPAITPAAAFSPPARDSAGTLRRRGTRSAAGKGRRLAPPARLGTVPAPAHGAAGSPGGEKASWRRETRAPAAAQPSSVSPIHPSGPQPGGMAKAAEPIGVVHWLSRSASSSRRWIGMNCRSMLAW